MWAFVKKEFLYIFRDYRTMIILFGMPLVQIMLFGFAITNDINNAHIAIFDNSKDVVTREITQKVLSIHMFFIICFRGERFPCILMCKAPCFTTRN